MSNKNTYQNRRHSSGKVFSPENYNLKSASIIGHDGTTHRIDIRLESFSFIENIYSPTIIGNFNLRDEVNLFENLPITGHEILNIELEKEGFDGVPESAKLKFYITSVSSYKRVPENENVSTYTLSGVAEHAYKSQFLKVSRAISGLTIDSLVGILEKDLGASPLVVGNCLSRFKGIIRTQTPLSACDWLLRKSYDDLNSPFFLWHSINGDLVVASYSELTKQEPYNVYRNFSSTRWEDFSKESYIEKTQKILELNSDIKMNKTNLLRKGVLVSKNNYLDIAKKQYTNDLYEYGKNFPIDATLNKKPVLSTSFQIDGQPLDSFHEAYQKYWSTNSLAYKGYDNFNVMIKESKGITEAIYESLNSSTHDIKVAGDMNINPGKVVEIKLNKSAPNEETKDEQYDKHLSGKFIITSTIHEFAAGEHYTRFKAKRDSFSIDI